MVVGVGVVVVVREYGYILLRDDDWKKKRDERRGRG